MRHRRHHAVVRKGGDQRRQSARRHSAHLRRRDAHKSALGAAAASLDRARLCRPQAALPAGAAGTVQVSLNVNKRKKHQKTRLLAC